jgi:putative transposase
MSAMRQNRYTDEQIASALRQAESGTAVAEICRNLGASERPSTDGRSSLPGWARWRSGG